MKYLKGLLLLLHSEKTTFTDQVRPLMPKDGGVLEVLSAHVYTWDNKIVMGKKILVLCLDVIMIAFSPRNIQ